MQIHAGTRCTENVFGSVIQETEDRLLYVKEREGQVDFWVSWTEGATGRMLYTCPEGLICDEMGTASYSDKPTEEKDDCSGWTGVDAGIWELPLKVREGSSRCPVCGTPYAERHQTVIRKLLDVTAHRKPGPVKIRVRGSRYICRNEQCRVSFYDFPDSIRPSDRMTDRFRDAVLFYGLKNSALDTARRFCLSDVAVGKILKQGLVYLQNRYPRYIPAEMGICSITLLGIPRFCILDLQYGLLTDILPDCSEAALKQYLADFPAQGSDFANPLNSDRVRRISFYNNIDVCRNALENALGNDREVCCLEEDRTLFEKVGQIEENFPAAPKHMTFRKLREWILYGSGCSQPADYEFKNRDYEMEDRSIRGKKDSFIHGGGVDLYTFLSLCQRGTKTDHFPNGAGVFVKGPIYGFEMGCFA